MARLDLAERGGSISTRQNSWVEPFFEQKGPISSRWRLVMFATMRPSSLSWQPIKWRARSAPFAVFGAADQIEGRRQKGLSNP
jgi:hypothetical protein